MPIKNLTGKVFFRRTCTFGYCFSLFDVHVSEKKVPFRRIDKNWVRFDVSLILWGHLDVSLFLGSFHELSKFLVMIQN